MRLRGSSSCRCGFRPPTFRPKVRGGVPVTLEHNQLLSHVVRQAQRVGRIVLVSGASDRIEDWPPRHPLSRVGLCIKKDGAREEEAEWCAAPLTCRATVRERGRSIRAH